MYHIGIKVSPYFSIGTFEKVGIRTLNTCSYNFMLKNFA